MVLIPQGVLDTLTKMQQQDSGVNVAEENTQAQPTQEQPTIDMKSYLGGLFEQQKNKQAPAYNTRFEQQQQALMKAQTIGNALALVGDVAGAAKGAPVKRRQFKSTEPYLQAIENKRLQYEKDKTAFDQNKYMEQLRLMGLISQEEARDNQLEQQKIANKRADKGLELQQQGIDLRKEGQDASIIAQQAQTKLGQDRLAETKRANIEDVKYKRDALTAKNVADMVKQVQKDEKGNLKLWTDDGKKVASIDDSKTKKALAMIMEDYGDSPELQKDITLLKAQFGEGLSKDAREFLVQKHWNNSPKAKKFLQLDADAAKFTGSEVGADAVANQNQDNQIVKSDLPIMFK